ncbi:MAG: DUF4097 domain-containing protein [Lachnospiraceae bacterium]|nr:DUF4097 domain-containing protein [Lachnospiraceae bacterium]
MERKMRVNLFEASDVKKLNLRIAAATVRAEESTNGQIRVEAKNLQDDRYTCELRAGKLVITYKVEGVIHLPIFGQDETEITLYLPANLSLEHAALEIGAGSMYLDAVPISCDKMEVEIGAGKWKAAHLSVSDNLNVEIGAGKAKMKGVTAGRLNVECGVGSSVYKGRVNGDIRVNCGVGSCSFQLDNKESDFNYDVSCAVGSVKINDNRLKSFASKKSYKNDLALGTAVFECGLGSIEFRTNGIEINSEK